MEQTGKKFHYGWLIIIGLCFCSLTTWQLTGSIASMFALPVTNALGINRGTFMFWMTCQSLIGLVGGPLWGALIQNKKVPIKLLMLIGVLANGCACFFFAAATSVVFLYIAGCLVGFGQCGVNNVAFAYFTSNWCTGKLRGTLLSVISCMAGIGGFFWPIIIQGVIDGQGWQMAYTVCGIIMLVCTIPWCFVYVRTPEEKGLKPLGYVDGSEEVKKDADLSRGVPFKKIIGSYPFWTMLIAALLLATFGGYKSNISGFTAEFLAPTSWAEGAAGIAAFMLSINAIMDMIGNLTLGPLCDKFGPRIPVLIWCIIAACCPLAWILLGGSPVGLYIGAFCFGIHGSLLKVGVPLILRKVYGPKDFGKAYGYFATAKIFVSGFASVIVATFFDLTGTYTGALTMGLVVIVIVAILIQVTAAAIGKFDWQNKDYSAA